MARVAVLPAVVTLDRAVSAFLGGYERIGSAGTRRVYGGTLNALVARYGAESPLAGFDAPASGEAFRAWFHTRWGLSSPATYDRHLATLQSAFGWWRLQGWTTADPVVGLTRKPVVADATRARPREEIAALWRMGGVALRERALWRLLYETAARADEILSLNVEDLDLANKRARVVGKGGVPRVVHWQTGAALLLPRLIAGRPRGPLFLSNRRPTRAVATVDLCPETGRARLSYSRAREIFKATTGLTLHQTRHSRLTHEAEDGTNTAMLLALSGHASVRSLARYARPGVDAVAAHVAATDPAGRRRT